MLIAYQLGIHQCSISSVFFSVKKFLLSYDCSLPSAVVLTSDGVRVYMWRDMCIRNICQILSPNTWGEMTSQIKARSNIGRKQNPTISQNSNCKNTSRTVPVCVCVRVDRVTGNETVLVAAVFGSYIDRHFRLGT